MPKFQKESFFKSIALFFIVIEILLAFIFYTDAKIQKEHLEENIYLKMKNYSYFFDNDKFDIDILNKTNQKLYELQYDNKNLYIYTGITDDKNSILKIIYPKEEFNNNLNEINKQLLFKFLIFTLVAFLISVLFSYYSLYPLQKSYSVLKEFMKDIIHDINTPISAMKLNISLINNKDDEIKSIEQSINTLEMLHKNLDNYTNSSIANIQKHNLKEIFQSQCDFFENLYDWIDFKIDIPNETIITTDKYMLSRVIYNLLNNACKYNTSDGFINITFKNNILTITNSSHGIKNPSKVFDRFYKESDRGLGIGLHIVDKLLNQLDIKYKLNIDNKNIVSISLTFQ